MRAPALVGIVIALHILAISAFVLIQGCGTTRTARTAPGTIAPPPPQMPPRSIPTVAPSAPISIPSPPAAAMPAMAASGITHTIIKGETLSHVAKAYGISTRELADFNDLSDPNKVRIGQTLQIPGPGGASAPAAAVPAQVPADVAAPGGAGSVYVVQAGDNLTKISRKYGTTVSALKAQNQMSSDRIVVGQKLTIPGAGAAASDVMVSVTEEVTVLDTDMGNVRIQDISVPADATPRVDVPVAQSIGQLPEPEAVDIPTMQSHPIDYTIVAGDNLDDIAKLFIVSKEKIMALNGMGPNDTLTPGQQIKIPPSEL